MSNAKMYREEICKLHVTEAGSDQAELKGVLNSLYAFHLPILSVELLDIE